MEITMNLVPIKKERLVITRELLKNLLGEHALYIFVIRLHRLMIMGRIDPQKPLQEVAVAAAVKFGEAITIEPDIYTISGAHLNFSKKWLEKAGRAQGDMAFAISCKNDPTLVAIQLLGPEELLYPSVKRWVQSQNVRQANLGLESPQKSATA